MTFFHKKSWVGWCWLDLVGTWFGGESPGDELTRNKYHDNLLGSNIKNWMDMPYAVCVPTWTRWLKKHLWITWYVSYDTLGDFNFRINEPADVHAAKFQGFDWAIQFDSTCQSINTCCWKHPWFDINLWWRVSDSYPYWSLCQLWPLCGSFHLSCVSRGTVRKSINYCKWKSVDIASVQSDISGAFIDFPLMISALLLDFIMIPLRILLKNTHPKNHGLWLSEQTNLCIRRNFRLKNGCGVNVKGNIKTPKLVSDKLLFKEQRNKYNNLLNSTKKDYIKNRIEKMRNPRKIYIRYVINC